MEKISKLAILYNTLITNNKVLVSKKLAEDFYIFCKMQELKVNFQLDGCKILFTSKTKSA